LDVDWNFLHQFVLIADCGNLTQTARIVGISQPTLSRNLKELEGQIGGHLFERLPNRLLLTPLGEEVLEQARAMKGNAENLLDKAQRTIHAKRLPVRISATMSVSLFLTNHLAKLSEAAMSHNAVITIEPNRSPLNLAFRQADLAIRLRGYPEEGSVHVRKVGKIAFSVYAARSNAPPKSIIGLTRNRPPSQPDWIENFAQREKLPITAHLGEYFLRHEAVRSGMGASLLPCFVGDQDPLLYRYCRPPTELDEEAFLMSQPDAPKLSPVRSVADKIIEIFKMHAELLAGIVQPDNHPPE
jgi:DNA-binding transcriptional LysR family regulator